jgi:hypothetical protein
MIRCFVILSFAEFFGVKFGKLAFSPEIMLHHQISLVHHTDIDLPDAAAFLAKPAKLAVKAHMAPYYGEEVFKSTVEEKLDTRNPIQNKPD